LEDIGEHLFSFGEKFQQCGHSWLLLFFFLIVFGYTAMENWLHFCLILDSFQRPRDSSTSFGSDASGN
jgi:hypothetical protein